MIWAWVALAWALDAFAWDALFCSTFVVVACALFAAVGVVRLVLYAQSATLRVASRALVIAVLGLTGAHLTRVANNHWAESSLRQVVAALEAYRAQNGLYPVSLAQLSPRFLAQTPWAKLNWRHSSFEYSCPECRSHSSNAFPDSISIRLNADNGRKMYDFRSKRWVYQN